MTFFVSAYEGIQFLRSFTSRPRAYPMRKSIELGITLAPSETRSPPLPTRIRRHRVPSTRRLTPFVDRLEHEPPQRDDDPSPPFWPPSTYAFLIMSPLTYSPIRVASPITSAPSPYRRLMARYFLNWTVASISRMTCYVVCLRCCFCFVATFQGERDRDDGRVVRYIHLRIVNNYFHRALLT